MRSSTLSLLVPLLLTLGLGACTEAPGGEAPGEVGVRLQLLDPEGCDPLPAGVIPEQITLVELELTNAESDEILQSEGLLVDPTARCADSDGNEFSCPFDADGNGLRERYFAFDAVPAGVSVVLSVRLKDGLSNVLWSGASDPATVSNDAPTVLSVQLKPSSADCQ